MSVLNWLKKKAATISLAMVNVEQSAIGQRSKELDGGASQSQRYRQGSLMDSLLQGEISQEVIDLRWRNYKVLEAMDKKNIKVKINNLKEDDNDDKPSNKPSDKLFDVVYEITDKDYKTALKKIKIDDFDNYPLELIIVNDPETISIVDSLNIDEFSGVAYYAKRANRPIIVDRTHLPKFEIEAFATKLNVRTINEKEKMLEFYISMYPDENNRNSRLLISEIKKAIVNPKSVNFLELNEVGFITNKAIGVPDFLIYQYKVTSFDKIILFNGNYVIKFIAEPLINGDSNIEQFRVEALDEKYNNNESR